MSALDPSYIRSIRDGIINGNIEANNQEALPDGLVGLYDKELFPPTIKWKERKETLQFFLLFALAQKEISADFAADILGDEWFNLHIDDESIEEKRLQKVNDLIQLHSKRFSSAGGGKYCLYHERFRVYILQKVSDEDIAFFNEKFVSLCEIELENNSFNAITEKEIYALEFMSKHIFIGINYKNNYNGDKLKKYALNKLIWKKQKDVSKFPDWTLNGLKNVLFWGLKNNDEDVFIFASEKIKFIKFYTDDLGTILSLIKSGNLENACKGFSLLFKKGEDGIEQEMKTYIIMFVYAALNLDNEKLIIQTLNRILELFKKNIPDPDSGFFLWSESCIPPVMVFNASLKAAELGCDWKIIWRNFSLENGHDNFYRSFDNDWILNIPLNNRHAIEIMSFILKPNENDLETSILRDKAHLIIKISDMLLRNNNDKGKEWIKNLLSNVYVRSDEFEYFDEIKKEIAIVLIKTENIKQALSIENSIVNDKDKFLFISFIIEYSLNKDDYFLKQLNEIITSSNNKFFTLIYEVLVLFEKEEFKQGLCKFDELVVLCKSKYDIQEDIRGELVSLIIKTAKKNDFLDLINKHYFNENIEFKREENLMISFALISAYAIQQDFYHAQIINDNIIELDWDKYKDNSLEIITLIYSVRNYLSILEIYHFKLFNTISQIIFNFFQEYPRFARQNHFMDYCLNNSFRSKILDNLAVFKTDSYFIQKLTYDLNISLTFNEKEISCIENHLEFGNYHDELKMAYLIPLFNPFMKEETLRNKIKIFRIPHTRNIALRNWFYFSNRFQNTELICTELLETFLGSEDEKAAESSRQFVLNEFINKNEWSSYLSSIKELNDNAKEIEVLKIAMYCAVKNDFQKFSELYMNIGIVINPLLFNLAFLDYYSELISIFNNSSHSNINSILLEPFAHLFESVYNNKTSNLKLNVDKRKIKEVDFEIINQNLLLIISNTINLLKQSESSEERDGYLLNLFFAVSPLIKDENELLSFFHNRSYANCANLIYLFKHSAEKFDHLMHERVQKCFSDLLSEENDYVKGRLFTSIYSIACSHVSFPEVKNWLLETKDSSSASILLSIKNKLQFGIYSQYFLAIMYTLEGSFDVAEIKIDQIFDIEFKESAMMILALESYCRGDINFSISILDKITIPGYITDSCNLIAGCFIRKNNFLTVFNTFPQGIWQKSNRIGHFIEKSESCIDSLLAFRSYSEEIASSIGLFTNAWNFEPQLAKFLIFKSQKSQKSLKNIGEAYFCQK
jgi:hypothetical protein